MREGKFPKTKQYHSIANVVQNHRDHAWALTFLDTRGD